MEILIMPAVATQIVNGKDVNVSKQRIKSV